MQHIVNKTRNLESKKIDLCKITEIGNKESDSVFIGLGSLVHRTNFAWGKLPELVDKEYGGLFVSFDYPKKTYDEDIVSSQVAEYIENSQADKIVLAGLSFGEIVVRDVREKLSEEGKMKVVYHISINGVSEVSDLGFLDSRTKVGEKVKLSLLSLFGTTSMQKAFGFLGNVDRGNFSKLNFFRKYKYFLSKNLVDSKRMFVGIEDLQIKLIESYISSLEEITGEGYYEHFSKNEDDSFSDNDNVLNEKLSFAKSQVNNINSLNEEQRKKLILLLKYLESIGVRSKGVSHELQGKFNDLVQKIREEKRHKKSASMGFTPGLAGRIARMKKEKTIKNMPDVDFAAIYSTDDDIYKNPKESAEKIVESSSNGKLIQIEKGGHAALVEVPKYIDEINKILSEIDGRETKLNN